MYARNHQRNAGKRAGRWIATAMAALALAACDETPVELPTATTVMVGPETITLVAGEETTIGAQILDQDSVAMEGMSPVWSTSDPSVVALFSDDGQTWIDAVSPGEATLTAAYGSTSDQVMVTVLDNDRDQIQSFAFDADTINVHINEDPIEVPYTAYDGDGDDTCLSNRGVDFETSDASIAAVDDLDCETIEIDLDSEGTATITGTIDGASGQLVVNVSAELAAATWDNDVMEPRVGETVTYRVKVVGETGEPIEGHTVNFTAMGGTLSSTSAETNGNGIASIDWTAPTVLTHIGDSFEIVFQTTLPGDDVEGDNINQDVLPGPADELVWYIEDDLGNWDEVDGSLELEIDEERRVIANLYDEYGNLLETDGTMTPAPNDGSVDNGNGTAQFYQEDQLDSDSPWIDLESAAETTATVTADLTDPDGNDMDDDIDVEFVDNS